jgi:minor extracellular serine protease Vpr
MKTTILCFAGLMTLGQTVVGQSIFPSKLFNREEMAAPTKYSLPTAGLSPRTAMLLIEMEKHRQGDSASLSRDEMLSEFGLIDREGQLLANVLILLSETGDVDDLQEFGAFSKDVVNGVATGVVAIDVLGQLASVPGVLYIQAGEMGAPTMDNARQQTWVDWVHQGFQLPQSYWGQNVVIGIIDQGFDYTHPNFYNEAGTVYRVKRVWEQMATSGTPPSPFTYGRELASQSAILNAQRDVIDGSHGAHVAGIAGGGGGTVNTSFRGVAPQSDLVFVSTPMTLAAIADGIQYIMSYANSVGKPCVINMSLGLHIGPHDGMSAFDQYCDGMVGAGRLLVGAAANDGSKAIYLGKSYSMVDTIMYTCVQFTGGSPLTSGSTTIDIWGNAGQNYWVSVNVFNSNTGQFEDWTPYIAANSNNTYNYNLYDDDPFFPDLCQVSIATSLYPLNNKRNVQIMINHSAQDDSYRWAMIEIVGFNVQTKMWAWGGGAVFTNAGYNAPVLSGSTSSTMGEIGGTGNAIISVGAYTSKNAYSAFSGGSGQIDFPGTQGAIASFSSKGPTADGRTKPDITAPGNVVMSSVNRFDNNYTSSSPYVVSGVTDGTNSWWFAGMSGTSMAAPVATGILALWLEAAPWLTQAQAKALAKNNAWTDSHTGSIGVNGSNTWGWGKIDAHEGMLALLATVNVDEQPETGSTLVFPNPSRGIVNVLFGSTREAMVAEVYDARGALVHTQRMGTVTDGQHAQLDMTHLQKGMFVVRLVSVDGVSSTHRVMLIE